MPRPAQVVAEHSFACALCGKIAGTVQLVGPANAASLIRRSFTSELKRGVSQESLERFRTALLAANAHTLYSLDREVASFYCPACALCYCGDHWHRWDVFDDDEGFTWHDSIRGRCPKGHERMLED